MRRLNQPFALACIAGVLFAFATGGIRAESQYPSQPITWVVGTSAGGASDVITRMVAKDQSRPESARGHHARNGALPRRR